MKAVGRVWDLFPVYFLDCTHKAIKADWFAFNEPRLCLSTFKDTNEFQQNEKKTIIFEEEHNCTKSNLK